MIEVVEVKKALKAFNIIREKGVRSEQGFIFQGITAETDFDGYTIFLKNDYVTLSIYFHNKFNIEFTNKKELTQFLEKIELIAKK